MKKTFVKIPELQIVDYNHSISFLGSCFSENISKKATINGFQVETNPLGVVFNPISLGDFLMHLKDEDWNSNIINRKDVFFSWEANSSVFGYSQKELLEKIETSRAKFQNALSKASTLFVTFGTAWVYELTENNHVVANCHKFDQSTFQKRLLSIQEINEKWTSVLNFIETAYPDLNVVFTVSPVRHVKDGLVENSRSKAILLESIHQLVDSYKKCHYFPAYEIVLDELRDYGFYGSDGLHPNDVAIDVVWSKFFESMLTREAKQIANEWMEIRKLFNHNIQYEKSQEAQSFLEMRSNKLEAFKVRYPCLINVETKNLD